MPLPNLLTSVSRNFNLQKIEIKKICQKCLFCHFHLAGIISVRKNTEILLYF